MKRFRCVLLASTLGLAPLMGLSQQSTPREQTTAGTPLKNEDVVSLIKAGLSPEVVRAKIEASPCRFDISPASLKDLKAAGVPDSVILAMVEARCPSSPPPEQPPAGSERSTVGKDPAGCRVRFAVYQANPHIPGGIGPGMSKEQRSWYEKKKGRYPSVCLNGESPDYFVVWSSRFSSGGAPEPIVNFGGMTGYVGEAGAAMSGYEVSSPMASEYVYLSIFPAEDVSRAQRDKSYQPKPVYYTQHDSWWTYRESHRKAVEDALKFLAGLAEK